MEAFAAEDLELPSAADEELRHDRCIAKTREGGGWRCSTPARGVVVDSWSNDRVRRDDPRPAAETPRQAIRRHLATAPHTAHELSALVHLPEKEIVPHLEHLARSLRGAGAALEVEPARCLGCGYVFRDRRRLSRPTACPRCRGQHLSPPAFRITTRVAAEPARVDRDAVARAWRVRGFSCDLWTDPPGQRWEDFAHAVDELVILVEGELEMEIDGRVVVPAAGEEMFIPARTRHSVRNTGGTTARWLYGYRQAS